jgi:hypothetical protein
MYDVLSLDILTRGTARCDRDEHTPESESLFGAVAGDQPAVGELEEVKHG